jgi:DNA-binding response OmpR family regulator
LATVSASGGEAEGMMPEARATESEVAPLEIPSTEAKLADVVIIDDDRSLLRLLRMVFEDANFGVRTYMEAQVALQDIPESLPDVIILDLEMPVMNGREFFRHIRDAGIETPVLILSAYGARNAQLQLGAEGYSDKPFDPEQLIETTLGLISSNGHSATK